MNSWECGVCGYVHKEERPPEKCPVCEAPEKMFKELNQEQKIVDKPDTATIKENKPEPVTVQENKPEPATVQEKIVEKRWRCTVCGYIHTGAEPPEKCPVCDAPKKMFVEIDADGKALTEVKAEEIDSAMVSGVGKGPKKNTLFF